MMNKRSLLYGGGGLLAVLVFFTIYASIAAPGAEEDAGPTFDESFEFVPSASFACDDESIFRAEFPDDDRVQIIVDGSLLREVPRAYAPLGLRFEDNSWIYAFRGFGLTITRKSDYLSTACQQVADPRRAPLDFGD